MNTLILPLTLMFLSVASAATCSGKRFEAWNEPFVPNRLTDLKGNRIYTLEDFLEGKAPYATLATDRNIMERYYGTPVCIPYVNSLYGRDVNFEVRDSQDDEGGRGFDRIDIYVRRYDTVLRKELEVYYEKL